MKGVEESKIGQFKPPNKRRDLSASKKETPKQTELKSLSYFFPVSEAITKALGSSDVPFRRSEMAPTTTEK